jgi:hypothetical protein
VPEGITADGLDPRARAQLRTLPGDLADSVGRWLVAASREEDPERAYEYALQARSLAARVGVVREVCGVAAYRAGRWADALSELRTARRLTGDAGYLPMMADAERALGRVDRALALIDDPAARDADRATQIELLIVASGIRRDQGRPAAGVAVLQVRELTDGRWRPWSARLFYAYADALLDAGREDEARDWFGHAAAVDRAEETDAAERYEILEGFAIEDLADPDDEFTDEPVTDEPVTDEPDADEPDADEPDADEPVTDEPVTDEPDADEPVTDEPVTDEPDADEPDAEGPDAEGPDVGGPGDASDDDQPSGVRAGARSSDSGLVAEPSSAARPGGEQSSDEQHGGAGPSGGRSNGDGPSGADQPSGRADARPGGEQLGDDASREDPVGEEPPRGESADSELGGDDEAGEAAVDPAERAGEPGSARP